MNEKTKDILVIVLAALTVLVCLFVLFTEFPAHGELEALATATPEPTAEPTPKPTAEPTPVPTPEPTTNPNEELSRSLLAQMATEDKVWQLFLAVPESIADVETVTATGDLMREGLESRPVGGLVYTAENTESSDQLTEMLSSLSELAQTPFFVAYDSDAGTSAVKLEGNMASLGFNLLLGDDSEPDVLHALCYEEGAAFGDAGILMISADFMDEPQAGAESEEDAEEAEAESEEESRGTPCCLSATYVAAAAETTGRNVLIATAPLRSVEGWSDGELAVGALLAGCDMIVAPADIDAAVEAVLDALNDGTLSQSRLNEAVQKILFAKLEAGLIAPEPEAPVEDTAGEPVAEDAEETVDESAEAVPEDEQESREE